MQRIFISILVLLSLSGCGLFEVEPPTDSLGAVSEACRARSASELSMHGLVNGESSQTRDAMFDKSYRGCMAEKGYDLPPAARSAGS